MDCWTRRAWCPTCLWRWWRYRVRIHAAGRQRVCEQSESPVTSDGANPGTARVSCSHLFEWSPFIRDHEFTLQHLGHRRIVLGGVWSLGINHVDRTDLGLQAGFTLAWAERSVMWSQHSVWSVFQFISVCRWTAESERGCKGQAKISVCCTSAAEVQSEINTETALMLPRQQVVKYFCKYSIDRNVSSVRGQPTPGFLLFERTKVQHVHHFHRRPVRQTSTSSLLLFWPP